MVFQQPQFLYGLFLLAIPILIHFLNFRKSKTIYFSSLRFIEEVNSTYRKRNRLEDLLMLLLRLLALALLILAFAQPVIPPRNSKTTGPSAVTGVFVDNSLSMELSEQGEPLLGTAKKKAREIVSALPAGSRFILLTNSQNVALQGITDKEITLDLIDRIAPSPVSLNLADILLNLQQGIGNQDTKLSSVILVSDFQESMFRAPLGINSSQTPVFLVPVRSSVTANISVDSCWIDNPITIAGQGNQIIARINNRSDQDYAEFPVRLIVNDTLRNETNVKLPAKTVTEVILGFHAATRGWQTGKVEISDFPVTFDNELSFAYRVESDLPVLQLFDNKENEYIKNVYGNDPYFKYESYSQKAFPRSTFTGYDLVVMSGIRQPDPSVTAKINDFLQAGGTVWFLPEIQADQNPYNAFLRTIGGPSFEGITVYRTESRIGQDQQRWLEEVVVNVDRRLRLPYFNQSLLIAPGTVRRLDLLNSVTGDPLLMQFRSGKGSVMLAAFPLDEMVTDFMLHPLFIPISYRIAILGKNSPALYRIISSDEPLLIRRINSNDNQAIRLHQAQTGFETTPAQHAAPGSETVLYPETLPAAGQYTALAGADTLGWVAVNYDRSESDLTYAADSVVSVRLKNAGWNIYMHNNSTLRNNPTEIAQELVAKKLWYYFLIIALLALLTESFVMNRKK
jgi:hypothetical protein